MSNRNMLIAAASNGDPYINQPLTITALQNSTIAIYNATVSLDLMYKTSYTMEWKPVNDPRNLQQTVKINLGGGGWLQLWNNGNAYLSSSSNKFRLFSSAAGTTGKFEISGNIMSLLDYEECCYPYCFDNLFASDYPSSSMLRSVKNLRLPSMRLAEGCYKEMFFGCSGVEDFNKLKLPATVPAPYCYFSMFNNCDNLTKAPVIHLESLAEKCLQYIFRECDNIDWVEFHFTEWGNDEDTYEWMTWCNEYGIFRKPSSLPTYYDEMGRNYHGSHIPIGWTVVDI